MIRKTLANALDFTLSIPLYIIWWLDGVTVGGLARLVVWAVMDPPGMKYGRGR